MKVSEEEMYKIAEWLHAFDGYGATDENGYLLTADDYVVDAKDLVEKCGLKDE